MINYATLYKNHHRRGICAEFPWSLHYQMDNKLRNMQFVYKKAALEFAETIGATVIVQTDRYIESLTWLDRDRLIAMGIEKARAEALTDMGCEDITTNGDFIYYAGECVGTVEQFIENTNSQPFDYESGCWIN